MISREMRLLFDRTLAQNPAGTGTFARGLLAALQALPEIEIVPIELPGASIGQLDVGRKRATRRLGRALAHLRYYGITLPRAAARCDVVFSPSLLGPLRGRTPSVITVHDLAPLLYPQTLDRLSGIYARTMLRVQLRRATAVCTVSRAVAGEISARFPRITGERIYVAPDAPESELLTSAASAPAGVTQPFFLLVGTIEPRKNQLTAIRAFQAALEQRPASTATMVLAGSPGWLYAPIERAIDELGLQTRVRRLGRVDLPTLKWLYQHARALLFPSLYEGFGIPVVEAFALGCPVIAARIPSVIEVAGEGTATLLPPQDVPAWAAAMVAAIDGNGPDTRDAARARAATFSWTASAEVVAQALRFAAGGEPARVGTLQ